MVGMADVAEVEWLSPAEIGRRLRCSARTVKRAIADGRLPAVQVSPHTTRVAEADYLAFVGKAAGGAGGGSVPATPSAH